MFWIVSWLLAAFLFWLSYVFFRKGFDELDDSYAFMLNAIIGVLIWIPFSLFIWVDWSAITSQWDLRFRAFWSAILSEAFVLYALSQGKISITWTVFSIYPIFTAILSIYINQELLSVEQYIAIIIVVLWIMLIWWEWVKTEKWDNKIIMQSILIALLSAFLVWIADSYWKLTLELHWFTTFLFCLAIAQPIVAYFNIRLRWLSINWFKSILLNESHTKRLGLGSLFNVVWLIFFWYAFDLLYAGVASALTWTYPAIMLIFAYFFLKERVSRNQYIWIVIVIIAVYIFTLLLH